jgi:hypothetical protein
MHVSESREWFPPFNERVCIGGFGNPGRIALAPSFSKGIAAGSDLVGNVDCLVLSVVRALADEGLISPGGGSQPLSRASHFPTAVSTKQPPPPPPPRPPEEDYEAVAVTSAE